MRGRPDPRARAAAHDYWNDLLHQSGFLIKFERSPYCMEQHLRKHIATVNYDF